MQLPLLLLLLFLPLTTATCRSGTPHIFELAIAYDHTFCSRYPPPLADSIIQNLVDRANDAFSNTCIRLSLVHLERNCNAATDPYRNLKTLPRSRTCRECAPADRVLHEFKNYWNTHRRSVRRDATVFISGFEDGTATLGLAFRGRACDSKNSYAWVEGGDYETFAHEVGHLLGATHGGGVMSGGQIDALTFDNQGKREIEAFVDDSFMSFCIGTQEAVCDASCDYCRSGKCIPKRVVPNGLVACAPAKLFYCVQREQGYNFAHDCEKKFVSQAVDPRNALQFCCTPPKSTSVSTISNRFSTLYPLSLPGGTRTNWLGHARTWRATLLDSNIVWDCKAPGDVAGREKSVAPTVTASPSAAASVGPEPVEVTTLPTAAASVLPSPPSSGEHGTCKRRLQMSNTTFACVKNTQLLTIRVPGVGYARLHYSLKCGKLTSSFSSNVRITHLTRIFSPVRLSRPAFPPAVPRGKQGGKLVERVDLMAEQAGNCCGKWWVYVRGRVCHRTKERCENVYRVKRVVVACVESRKLCARCV